MGPLGCQLLMEAPISSCQRAGDDGTICSKTAKTITVAPLGTLSLYLSKDADGIHWWPWLARAIASRWSWRCFYSLKALTVIGLHEAESRCVRLN